MKIPSKYAVLALAIVASLTLKVGVMRGGADYHYVYPSIAEAASAAFESNIYAFPTNIMENVYVTAYSSRPQETDSSPFITASNKHVRDGIVAANWLPFGTRVRIPALFGEKIFVVEDRMHRRNAEKLDIWFASTKDAINFGVRKATIEIL